MTRAHPPSPQLEPASVSWSAEELRRAEDEISRTEEQVAGTLDDMERRRRVLHERLQALQGRVQTLAHRAPSPALDDLLDRCREARVQELDTTVHWEASRRARREALAARRRVLDHLLDAATNLRGCLDDLESQLDADEAAFAALPPPPTPRHQPQEEAPSAAERRRAPRARIEAVVTFESEDNFFTGFSADLSEGGLFVTTVDLLPLGSTVSLAFSLPSGHRATLAGEVRWIRDYNDFTPDLMPGMGIQFREVDPQTLAAISEFVQSREPLFFA